MAGARNIYEQQACNKRMTAVIVTLYIAVLPLTGYTIDVFLLGLPNANIPLPPMTILTIGITTGLAIGSLSSGWEAVLKSTGAVPVNPNDALQKQLLNVVEEMKIAEVFGTHPPVLKRINRLEAMAYRIRPQVPHVPQVLH